MMKQEKKDSLTQSTIFFTYTTTRAMSGYHDEYLAAAYAAGNPKEKEKATKTMVKADESSAHTERNQPEKPGRPKRLRTRPGTQKAKAKEKTRTAKESQKANGCPAKARQ